MRKLYIYIGHVLFPLLLPFMRPLLRRTERVYVAVIYEGKLVLIKNWLARDTWRLPGGGIGKNESIKEAAVREVKEELRLVLQSSKLVLIDSGIMKTDNLGYHYTNYAYLMDTFPRRLEDMYEIIDYGTFDDAPNNTQDEVRRTIGLLKKRKLL